MRHILEQAAHVARGRAPVLLRGEPGVGKERLATRIHATSPRRDMPLVVCHCGAVPPERLEAELCGYQKGAFPGAVQTQKGLFEQAHMGTLFLDAVEDLGPEAQAALLRLLQEHEVLRLGASEPVTADVRVIAASGAPLDDLAARGDFSPELFARLNVCALLIPPCANDGKTSSPWRNTPFSATPNGTARPSSVFPTRPWSCCRAITGPATCPN